MTCLPKVEVAIIIASNISYSTILADSAIREDEGTNCRNDQNVTIFDVRSKRPESNVMYAHVSQSRNVSHVEWCVICRNLVKIFA